MALQPMKHKEEPAFLKAFAELLLTSFHDTRLLTGRSESPRTLQSGETVPSLESQ